MTDKTGWSIWRLWPLAVIALGLMSFFLAGGARWLNFDELQHQRQNLTDLVQAHYWQAVIGFICVYVLVVAFSLPGAVVLTLAGGFMFGALAATCYIVVAATTGAVILFLAARSALGDLLRARAGPWMAKLTAGFQRNAWSYMLILRLVPLFPFFVVNLVPAFLGVSLRCFAVTTFFGIVPATYVYALIGTGIGDAVGAGGDVRAALSPGIVIGLLGLAALSALPILIKRLNAGRTSSHD